jgi:hypothetical protein
VNSCERKNKLFGLLKGNMDSQIGFCLVLTLKNMFKQRVRISHFDVFVRNWVHI